MDLPELAAFKYQHGGTGEISKGRLIAATVVLTLALIALFILVPLAVFLLFLGLILLFHRDTKLYLGPRYLLCGAHFVYYANVTTVVMSESEGTLSLESNNGKTFVLERAKFPTGARKADKIARNKAAKFTKISNKIVEKVRKAAVGVRFIGGPFL